MIGKNISTRKEFVKVVAKRANFTQGDVEIILDTITKIFEEATLEGVEIRVRKFGRLYHQTLPERKGGLNGKILPPARRTAFRLADNIRSGGLICYDNEEESIQEEET
jgi:nucleoid DNA-binding protein